MNKENEITVEVDMDLNSLIKLLEEKGFILRQEYELNDIYLVNNNSKDEDYLSTLNRCVLIRNILINDESRKLLTYKYKEYNDKKEIINQSKINIKIDDIDNTKLLFESVGFEELIRVNDHLYVYGTDKDEMAIQCVNNKHIYIEIEEKCGFNDRVYNSIDEMKNVIYENNIPIKNNDFFVKKAEIELKEKYGK